MSSSYVLLNGLRFHYLRWSVGDGEPIVMLHGLASNARIWELVAPPLAAQGFLPYALDSRGHGLSDKPDGEYNFEVFFQDLSAFIERCNLERPILVGHSWGASIALEYAARVNFGPRAPSAIVLVDGGIIQMNAIPGAEWETMRKKLTPPNLAGMSVEDFVARLRNPQRAWQPDEQAIAILLNNFEIDEEDRITPRLTLERHMQIVRSLWDYPAYTRMKGVRCPIAAVLAAPPHQHSKDEKEFLAAKQAAAARLLEIHPSAEVTWFHNTIHDIPLQRPVELADKIAVITRKYSPQSKK